MVGSSTFNGVRWCGVGGDGGVGRCGGVGSSTFMVVRWCGGVVWCGGVGWSWTGYRGGAGGAGGAGGRAGASGARFQLGWSVPPVKNPTDLSNY